MYNVKNATIMKTSHSSFGKMRLKLATLCMIGTISFNSAMASCSESQTSVSSGKREQEETALLQKDLGGISPEKALEYMKTTENLVIVDVASRTNYARKHFEGAVNIPIENLSSDEEKELYMKLPKGRPIMLHCRLGMIVPGAYRTLKALRPDIPEISYIDGRPPFDEYNDWVKSKQ